MRELSVPSTLRIARASASGLKPLIQEPAVLHERLQRLIRRHLPGVTASILAEPRALRDGETLDWYSDLTGQPIRFSDLSAAQQAAARALLQDRLGSLSKLADELPRVAPEAVDLVQPLRSAIQYPGDDYLYMVDGQPVLTFWGYLPPAAARSFARQGGAGGTGALAGTGPPLWPWLLALLLVTTVAVGGWLWYGHQLEQGLRSQLDVALAAECQSLGPLNALEARLLELDPLETEYPEIWQRVNAELERCSAAARSMTELVSATGDCARLNGLRQALMSRDLRRPPFAAIAAQLDAELAVCATAKGFEDRLAAAAGDCAAVASLNQELGKPPRDALPLVRVRALLDDEMELCALAQRLGGEIDGNLGNCPLLHRLDGQLAELDSSRLPLSGVRERLDLELELCAKAELYARRLLEAQSDCDALELLDQSMQAEDVSREPLLSVRARLDELLDQCKSLDDLEQALAGARGDCAKLALLDQRLEAEGPRNPLFYPVKKQLLEERRICELVDSLGQALRAALGDCEALAGLQARISAAPGDDPRFGALKARWKGASTLCRLAEGLERKLAQAGSDCARLARLNGEIQSAAAETPGIEVLRKRFVTAWRPCRRPPTENLAQNSANANQTPAKEKRPRPKGKKRKVLCPGERPKALAPDLVVVFDASASMDRPINENAAMNAVRQGLHLGGLAGAAVGILIDQASRGAGGPRRIEVAKDAAGRIVRSLPGDVDVGLVLVEDCPRARAVGFFTPGQRGSLIRGINAIHPVSGTPLASGIERAASMVDGVTKPAVVVILSDGKESCNRDPCAVARQVAKRKPLLTINVVDITGTGAGNCAARATGGKVYTAKNAQQVKSMMHRATQEVRGPAECNRR